MKKLYKRSLATYLVLAVLLFILTPTAMAFNSTEVKEIFPEEQIEQLIDQNNFQVISPDNKPLVSRGSRDNALSMGSGDDHYGLYLTRTGVILVTPDKLTL